MMPVPSAGIKPEHAPLAKKDFGKDFVLNAGTGIFSSPEGIQKSIEKFREELDKI
jgi:2,3-diketo-5-methylthiopentyl-1-phosphate enolase